jgi:hypothetical protein
MYLFSADHGHIPCKPDLKTLKGVVKFRTAVQLCEKGSVGQVRNADGVADLAETNHSAQHQDDIRSSLCDWKRGSLTTAKPFLPQVCNRVDCNAASRDGTDQLYRR